MFEWEGIAKYIPTVKDPIQKLTFREKALWTSLMLLLFFILGSINAWGINAAAVSQFQFLEIVFGSRFGSLLTLGIGPIVTASIILQLFVGSKIINWDTNTEEGKRKFSAAEKILMIAFCIIEAIAYVVAGAVPPAQSAVFSPTLMMIFVTVQLAIGGVIVVFMDEVCSKWGFGSGVSLFIAAGVAKTIIVRTFNPLTSAGMFPQAGEPPAGILPLFITSLIEGTPSLITLLPLIATLIVFILVVYIQDVRVELPMAFSLPFGKFGSRRWPLKFLYTSNIPVILTAAVIANLQVVGRLLYQKGITFLGVYNSQGTATSGVMFYLSNPSGSNLGIAIVTIFASIFALAFVLINVRVWRKHTVKFSILGAVIGLVVGYFLTASSNPITTDSVLHSLIYISVFVLGSTIFSLFWVNTAGMDSKTIAEQFKAQSMIIPGFRHDPRIIEKVLDKYIPALTIMGGALVGFIASFADLTSAIGTGTGILLTVMIIYQFYEQITSQHGEDIPERIRKFLGV